MRRRAFSITELAVAVVIVGVLGVVAVVGFQAVFGKTSQAQARQLLDRAAATLQLHYTSRGFFPGTGQAASKIDDSIQWVEPDVSPTQPGEVSVTVTPDYDGNEVLILTTVAQERCFTLAVGPRDAAGYSTPFSLVQGEQFVLSEENPSCAASALQVAP